MLEEVTLEEDILRKIAGAEPRGISYNELRKELGEPHPTKFSRTMKRLRGEKIKEKLVETEKRGNRKFHHLTKEGWNELTRLGVSRDAGTAGEKLIQNLKNEDYDFFRYLYDLTKMKGHETIIVAWNSSTKDIKLLKLFKPREFSTYEGFKANERHPLQRFIRDNVRDYKDDHEIAKALKNFFDYPQTHDAFFASTSPDQPISFGMPSEISLNPSYTIFMCAGYHTEPPPVEMLGTFTILSWPKAEHLALQSTLKVTLQELHEEGTSLVCGIKTLAAAYQASFEPICKDSRKGGFCIHYGDSRKCVMEEAKKRGLEPRELIQSCEVLLKDVKNIKEKRLPKILKKQEEKRREIVLEEPLTEHSVFYCKPILNPSEVKRLMVRLSRIPKRKQEQIIKKEIYRSAGFEKVGLKCVNCELACPYNYNPLECPIIIKELSTS